MAGSVRSSSATPPRDQRIKGRVARPVNVSGRRSSWSIRSLSHLSVVALFVLNLSATAAGAAEYKWSEVAEGIYLSSQIDPLNGPIDGNSVVIVTDVDVVVVDTHIDPAAARQVIERIRKVTDKPVSWVLNTHWHDDHVYGNGTYRAAFPEAKIVAHPATVEAAKENWQPSVDQRIENYQAVAEVDLEAAAAGFEAEDPQKAMDYRVYGQYRDALLPELSDLKIVYPDVTVNDLLRLERGERTLEICSLGHGNTEGDLVVWLPEERILVSGDIIVSPTPFAYSVSFPEWIETLGAARGPSNRS